jgi:hypothetical protein
MVVLWATQAEFSFSFGVIILIFSSILSLFHDCQGSSHCPPSIHGALAVPGRHLHCIECQNQCRYQIHTNRSGSQNLSRNTRMQRGYGRHRLPMPRRLQKVAKVSNPVPVPEYPVPLVVPAHLVGAAKDEITDLIPQRWSRMMIRNKLHLIVAVPLHTSFVEWKIGSIPHVQAQCQSFLFCHRKSFSAIGLCDCLSMKPWHVSISLFREEDLECLRSLNHRVYAKVC